MHPGSFLSVGISFSAFDSAYGQQHLAGHTLFLDANLYRRVGVEIEGRSLSLNAQEQLREQTLLAGPRISTHGRNIRPYIKLLAGRGNLDFPFHDAHGTYFVAAPGAGLDLRIAHGIQVRVLDVEYQLWPQFTFGAMHPWGVSSGVSLRIF